jgi:hypothetical protein
MLEVGKLYSCSGYYLMLYPDKETATTPDAPISYVAVAVRRKRAVPLATVAMSAASWSKTFGKPVSYCNTETPLLVLSADKEYVEVLAGDQKGWIFYQDWLKIKEIVDAAA